MSTGLAARQELQLSPGGQKRQNMKLRFFNYLLASIPIVPGVFAQEPPVPIAPFALRFEEITKSLVQWIDDDPEFGMNFRHGRHLRGVDVEFAQQRHEAGRLLHRP